jgi:hypothetical protein
MSTTMKARNARYFMTRRLRIGASRSFWSLVAIGVLLLAPRAANATYVFKNVMASKVFRTPVNLVANTTYTFETTALSPSTCDPVMYLYRNATFENSQRGTNISTTNKNDTLTFRPTTSQAGDYDLIVRSATASCTGSVKKNGTIIASAQPFAGTLVSLSSSVPSNTLIQFETVLTRGGSSDTRLWGLNSSGFIKDFDDEGGVGHASRIENRVTRSVLVSSYAAATTGYTDLYVNPQNDAQLVDTDGDGLADVLEAEIGTCPASCANGFDPTDSDRDGIDDAYEVFGVEDEGEVNPQLLPQWGANPRHKDLFVEWDWDPAYGAARPFTVDDALQAQTWMVGGSANDLLNPDGVAGFNIHIDCGISNSTTGSTVHGDWGGSNMAVVNDPTDPDSVPLDTRNFAAVRRHIFRHAYMWSGGGGASGIPATSLYWAGDRTNRNTHAFAHELGHSMGLQHWGHDSWGRGDCKPTYPSVMSYFYMGTFGFSTGAYKNIILNGAGSSENNPFGAGGVPSFLRTRWFYQVDGTSSHVDWNRDLRYEMTAGVSVRNAIQWPAAGGECNPFTENGIPMAPELNANLNLDTPALIRYNGRIYIFYSTARGLVYKSAPIGGIDVNGSCGGTNCFNWSGETLISTPIDSLTAVAGVTAWVHNGVIMVVYRMTNGQVYIRQTVGASAAGVLNNWLYSGNIGVMDATPTITSMYVNPAFYSGVSDLPVIFGSVSGVYRRWTGYVIGAPSVDDVLDGTGHQITGSISPTVVPWPNRGGVDHASNGTNCAVFVSQTNEGRFYCYDKSVDRWKEYTSLVYQNFAMPKTRTKVGLAFHVLRNGATAAPLANDVARGQFWMTVIDADKNGDGVLDPPGQGRADLYVTGALTNAEPPALNNNQMKFWTKGPYVSTAFLSAQGTNVGLYEDESISAIKGVLVRGSASLMFLPHADGTVNEPLRDGNDFQIIERGICRGLLEDPNGFDCGSPNVYGY